MPRRESGSDEERERDGNAREDSTPDPPTTTLVAVIERHLFPISRLVRRALPLERFPRAEDDATVSAPTTFALRPPTAEERLPAVRTPEATLEETGEGGRCGEGDDGRGPCVNKPRSLRPKHSPEEGDP
jgi:hypothetical protein